jgi:RNA polymerase sigma-70 factor, ECF subfamily
MDRRLSKVFSLAKKSSRQSEEQPALLDLRQIYHQHAEFLWKSLYRMGIAEPDLPDATQQVLLVLHRKLEQFDGNCRMTSFIFGICLRVAATVRRTQRRRREEIVDPDVHMGHLTNLNDPEKEVALADARRSLNEALDELSPEKRAVFVMYELEEMPCSEIAQLLDIPKGTVFSRLHAARAEFKSAFERIELRDQAMAQAGGDQR